MANTSKTEPKVSTASGQPAGLSKEEILALMEQVKAEAKAEAIAEMQAQIDAAKAVDVEAETEKALENSEKAMAEQEKTMKSILLAQPKKTILIPEDPLNANEPLAIGINGVIFAVPRGVEVEVPQSVYEVWKDSYERTRKANNRITVKEIKELTVDGEIVE